MSYYIYKICCDDLPDFVYIGSTKSLIKRKHDHKRNSNENYKIKLYNTIRENGGWDNWRMVILEDCGEISLTEARIKEEEWRVKLNANLNTLKCYRTEEQKIQDSRDNAFKYYNENKEKINKKITCECGRIINNSNLNRHISSKIHKKEINEN